MSFFAIEIPKRSRNCAKAQEPLLPGTEYFSILIEDKKTGGWQRLDFCPTCWPEAKVAYAETLHTYWKSQIPKSVDNSEVHKNRNEKALEHLRNALKSTDDQAEAFVLALYLVRNKILAYRQKMVHEGVQYHLYEVLATEEMLPVKQMPLSQLQVEKLQTEIAAKLK